MGLTGCVIEEDGIQVSPPPPTKMNVVVNRLHGVDVPDPYQWLEDQGAPETRAWIDAQNAYTDSVLDVLPRRDEISQLAANVIKRDAVGLPAERAGLYFFSMRRADQQLDVIYVREGLHGSDRVLIDPHPNSLDHTTSVELGDLSADGT